METLKAVQPKRIFKKSNLRSSRIEFGDFFHSEFFLSKFGVQFLNSTMHPQIFKWREIHFDLTKISTAIVVVLSIVQVSVSIFSKHTMIITIEAMAAAGIFSLMLLKIYVVTIRNYDPIIEILDTLGRHFPNNKCNQHTFNVQKYLRILNLFSYVTITIYMILWLQFCSLPLWSNFIKWIDSQPENFELIIKFYVPFDHQNPLIYCLIFTFQSWILLTDIIAFLATELLYFGLVIVLSMMFDILSQMINEIDPQQENAIRELKKKIRVHQELIKVSEQLQEIFSLILFINIIGMVYLICGTAFLSVVSIDFFLF